MFICKYVDENILFQIILGVFLQFFNSLNFKTAQLELIEEVKTKLMKYWNKFA